MVREKENRLEMGLELVKGVGVIALFTGVIGMNNIYQRGKKLVYDCLRIENYCEKDEEFGTLSVHRGL